MVKDDGRACGSGNGPDDGSGGDHGGHGLDDCGNGGGGNRSGHGWSDGGSDDGDDGGHGRGDGDDSGDDGGGDSGDSGSEDNGNAAGNPSYTFAEMFRTLSVSVYNEHLLILCSIDPLLTPVWSH